jgi:2-desacetyl-2-hydroxyethyl bacteriochlorophyllide A dehydrogenase
MKAVVVTGPGQVELGDVADPSPAPGEVVLQVESVGICGTDLHILDGDYIATYPAVPGHEFAGRVVAVGSGVTDLKVGQGVTADPNVYCGRCPECRHGWENLCRNAEAIGVNRPGAAAEYVAVPAANCVSMLDDQLAGSSLVEPLSCAVHGMDVVGVRIAARVLIYGAGPMGLMLTTLSRQTSASDVAVVDLNRARLTIAARLGASDTATSAVGLVNPSQYDVVIDCTGVPAVIQDAIERVAPGGTFLQFGVTAADATVAVRPEKILMDEITITGARAVKRSFERAATLYQHGAIDPADFVTHRFPLTRFDEALRTFRTGEGVKVQITP